MEDPNVVAAAEIVREMEIAFPRELQIAILTVQNRRQGALIAEQRRIIEGQRNQANEDAWKRDEG